MYLLRQVLEWCVDRKLVFGSQRLGHGSIYLAGIEAPTLDIHSTALERLVPLDELIEVGHLSESQSRTVRTCAERRVKREKSGGQLLHADVAIGTGVFSRIKHSLAVALALYQSSAQLERRLQAVCQPARHTLFNYKSVNYDGYGMLKVFIQSNFRSAVVILYTVDDHAHIPAAPHALELLGILPLSTSHHGRNYLNLTARRISHNLVGNLVYALSDYLLAAIGTVRNAYPCIQQTHIVVYLRDSAHRRARIVRSGLLIDRYRGRQSLYQVDVGLVHLPQELPCVRGERLHISALPFGKYRIEGKRRLARAAEPRKHHQLIPGYIYVDILEIVDARAPYLNQFLHCMITYLASFSRYNRPRQASS